MNDIPLSALFGTLVILILLSAFFSGSETGLMTLNRYRLRHLAKAKHAGALRSSKLLETPDRLIGLILLCNNFVNILASSVATVIGLRLSGEAGIAIAAGLLTLVLLIFGEVAPKTLAALNPERIAFPASFIIKPLMQLFAPVVTVVNLLSKWLLKALGISTDEAASQALSSEELRTVVIEAGALIPRRHQKMLLNILDLEKVTVEDIMVPRNEIVGIDLDDDIATLRTQLTGSQYTRLPVYRESIDNVLGFLHLRYALEMLIRGEFTHDDIIALVREAHYIPENTPLNTQLLNFQREKRRIGLVVNEYGDIRGLATLEDILEEIVGEFTTDPTSHIKDVFPQDDGSYLIDGSASLRTLNRRLNWRFPTDGPKTLNGLILEYLESMPEPGTSLLLAGHPVEIIQVKDNAVKTARVSPPLRKESPG